MNAKKANKLNRNTLSRQERLCSMKKLFHVALALVLCVSAAFAQEDVDKRVDGIAAQIDRVMSKAGIHFNGEFRSQFLNSQVSGSAVEENQKKSESAEFTSVDFNVVARPNTALSARAMFRLHQDWRNFFSDVQNPIATRWLSVDGSALQGIFKYNVGDYTKKLTPLTLWSPDLDPLLYEPEIFAQGREYAMSEMFLGDNNRILQGVNLEFRTELGTESGTILKELSADIFGARLATRGTGESAISPPPGIATPPNSNYWDADYDKYLLGFNLSTQIIEGAGLGVSDVMIFDYVASSKNLDDETAKLGSQSNNVFAGRLNLDNRVFMSDEVVRVGVNAEVAFSADKKYYMENTSVADSAVSGMAINAGLSLRLALGEENAVNLKATFIQNDTAFRNDAAQSPSFVQRTIMNNENGLSGLGLMNPFDALYRTVFKYTPSQYFAGPKPQTKNAYTNAILVRPDGGYGVFTDGNVFQAALPGGFATADRTGPVVDFDGSFLDKALTVGARLAMLKAVEERSFGYDLGLDPVTGMPNVGSVAITPEYMTAGGGASVDVAKFVPVLGQSLKIGGSFMMYNATTGNTVVLQGGTNVLKTESASQLISAELNYNFVSRFSFLVGYQLLNTTIKGEINGNSDIADAEYNFSNFGVGLGYKVADGGALTVKLTRLTGEGPVGEFDAATGKNKNNDYIAMQPEVYLTVKF